MKPKPIRIVSDREALAMLERVPPGANERDLPLSMRGGLLGIYGFGPNPAREKLERQNDR